MIPPFSRVFELLLKTVGQIILAHRLIVCAAIAKRSQKITSPIAEHQPLRLNQCR
jgi:hypothetical protein